MFIRTNEEIYDTNRTHDLEIKDNKAYQTISWLDYRPILLGTIVEQAETIEELCDKFVIFDKCDALPHIRTSFKEVKAYKSIYDKVDKKFIKKIYGAIWTDKGLIYVAKMNEKGELELL